MLRDFNIPSIVQMIPVPQMAIGPMILIAGSV